MTFDEFEKRRNDVIEESKDDSEVAHVMRDDLLFDILKEVSFLAKNTNTSEAKDMASSALAELTDAALGGFWYS